MEAGVAGTWAADQRTAELAARLATTLGYRRVTVTNDVVCAFAGAFGPRGRGVMLAAGTGALALAVGPAGRLIRVDGWGHVLGDAGSGHWLGREGLRAVMAAHDGRGRPTTLTRRATERFAHLERLPDIIAGAPEPVRIVAAFCEDVLRAADEGKHLAQELVAAVIDELAVTAETAVRRSHPRSGPPEVAFVGGLVDQGLRERLQQVLSEQTPGVRVRGGGAGALVGAASLIDGDGRWSRFTSVSRGGPRS